LDSQQETRELLEEAREDLDRATRYSGLKDWVGTVHYGQLTIEKAVKAVVSCFEAYEWTHDPSEQIQNLVGKGLLKEDFLEIAAYAHDAAPWHGGSTYGRRIDGVRRRPSELCTEEVAVQLLDNARKTLSKARAFAEEFFKKLEDGHRTDKV
jgi:HEPN domain-containing protein